MKETVESIVVVLGITGLAFGLLICASYVWAAFTGRRNEGMDEEYEARLCPSCGYDLRSSPGRCPECGERWFDRRRYLRSLAEDWPDETVEPRIPDPDEHRQLLLSTESSDEADLLCEQLNVRGVAASVEEASIAGELTREGRTEVFHHVMVYAADFNAAAAYLHTVRESVAEEV